MISFEELEAQLGIVRNVLADRLVRLVRFGILTRQGVPDDRRKVRTN